MQRKRKQNTFRRAGEEFIIFLYKCNIFKEKWTRIQLGNVYYNQQIGYKESFSQVLYFSSRLKPQLLQVRGGVTVIFITSNTEELLETIMLPVPRASVINLTSKDLFHEFQEQEQHTRGRREHYVMLGQFDHLSCVIEPGRKPRDNFIQAKPFSRFRLNASTVPPEVKSVEHKLANKNKLPFTQKERKIMNILENTLALSGYMKKFQILLHLEEIQQTKDMERYTILPGTFKEANGYLCLEIPGLAEKRPSLVRRDRITARKLDTNGKPYGCMYEGFIHHVELKQIRVKFSEKFHDEFIPGLQLSIKFWLQRHPLKMMHQALKLSVERRDIGHILFPESRKCSIAPNVPMRFRNKKIENNAEQRNAVKNILSETSAPVYFIYGPPGTGKTVTMVEAIVQTLEKHAHFHVLVCAPSNSACDLLTRRIQTHVDQRHILRFNAPSRNPTDMPDFLLKFSNIRNGKVYIPDKDNLMDYRLIVCTLITAGRLALAEFPTNHFNKIFIDEAGQSMEPELIVAISGVLADNGKLVLAGDPKQLGPIVRSAYAKKYGLGLSFMERIMGNPSYKKTHGVYDQQMVTKLLKNYRSHEAIIKISNEEFYDNELEVFADEFIRYSLCMWSELPQRNFPIIFKDVNGKDQRDDNSPSFYNQQEIKVVKAYVQKLIFKKGYKIEASEIGIITPYRKQVQKIRKEIDNPEIKVGSVEEFQGQERQVIIISTVRSSTVNLRHDARFHLGFLTDPKRFNVAVTRAKSLLIIVGNAQILRMDMYWSKLYEYCKQNNSYIGRSIKESDIPMKEDYLQYATDSGEEETDFENFTYAEWRRDP